MLFLHNCELSHKHKIENAGYKRENKFKSYEKQAHPRLDHLNFS